MSMDTSQLRILDRLLDEALELGPGERERWLAALAPEAAHLAPMLRELLSQGDRASTTGLIGARPRFDALAADEEAAAPLAPGVVLGSYRLLRELGTGGMGVVWLAERTDGLIDRPVALKLPLFSIHHRALAERFARERTILARLEHPGIARLYDAGFTAAGQPYLALEFVEGRPLTAWCDERRLTVRERIQLVVRMLDAVQYAHANLVIHRDLKPANILVTPGGDVRLLDFGIATLVVDGQANESDLTRLSGRALTPRYAAPELFTGTNVGIASDVYSAGVILYELLAGASPYRPQGDSDAALRDEVLGIDPVRPSLAATDAAAERRGLESARKLARQLVGDLDVIALKALKKRPEERYGTAAALAADLERHLRNEPIDARADSAWYRAGRLLSRHRVAFFATALIAVAIVAGASVALWQAGEARRETALATAVQEFLLDLFRANSADQADPVRARQTTARELLDRGRERVSQALRDQPAARLELLGTLSELYRQLGLWAESNDLASQRLALMRSLFGPNDLRVADAIGDHAIKSLHHRESATPEGLDAMVREAIRIHDLHGDTTSLGRARLHERASMIYMDQSVPAALEHASRAVELYRSRYPTDPGYVQALSLVGTAQLRIGRDLDAAVTAQEEALRVARSLRMPDHVLLYFLRRAGEVNGFVGRTSEADPLLREALAMSERINGEKHSATVAIRRALARNLAWLSRLDEAAAVAARTIADTQAAEHPETYLVRDNLRLLFDVHWARGDLPAARDGALAALRTFGETAPDSFEHADLLVQLAAVESAYGRDASALASLARAAEIARRAKLPETSTLSHNLSLREASARLGAGDPAAARTILEKRLEAAHAGTDLASRRAVLEASLVDALIALEELPMARKVAEQARAALASEPRRATLANIDAQVERASARARMADGQYAAALPHLARAAELYRRHHVAGSPWRAEAEALRSLCLARLGRRDEARSALALARGPKVQDYEPGARMLVAVREAEAAMVQRAATK